jgi:hypothetical protein
MPPACSWRLQGAGEPESLPERSQSSRPALSRPSQEVRLKSHGTDVVIPIIGSDLARSGLSRMQLSKLIITSFVVASKREFITRKLTLMIYPKDLDSIDFYELEDFIKSICF